MFRSTYFFPIKMSVLRPTEDKVVTDAIRALETDLRELEGEGGEQSEARAPRTATQNPAAAPPLSSGTCSPSAPTEMAASVSAFQSKVYYWPWSYLTGTDGSASRQQENGVEA